MARDDLLQLDVRLTIELVPKTCWLSNLRDTLSKSEWNALRRRVYDSAGHVCEVCGGRGSRHPVECHEEWDYDDEHLTQSLARLVALCPSCHEVKHIGLAGIRGRRFEALEHLSRVNGWPMEVAENYAAYAMAVWRERSRHQWRLNLDALASYGIDPAGFSRESRRTARSGVEKLRTRGVK